MRALTLTPTKKLITYIIGAMLVIFSALAPLNQASAQLFDEGDELRNAAGYSQDSTIGSITGTIVNAFLGVLGVLTVILIILGGFKWMTSSGNEEKVGEAKKLMSAGIIGLIIIVAAFAISKFVIQKLSSGAGVEGDNSIVEEGACQLSDINDRKACISTGRIGRCSLDAGNQPFCKVN